MRDERVSISQLATVICSTEQRVDYDQVLNQLRGVFARIPLESAVERVYGPRGAILYRPSTAIRARLLIGLVDLGVRSSDLAQANEYFDKIGVIDLLKQAALDEVDWFLTASLDRIPGQDIRVSFAITRELGQSIVSRHCKAGVIICPLSNLSRPLIGHFGITL